MQYHPADANRSQASHLVGSPLGSSEAALHGYNSLDIHMPNRPVSPLTEIRRKVKVGVALTENERAQLNAYYGRYTRRKQSVHLKGDREKLWTELAHRQGVSLSSWIQERVDEALHGHEEAKRALREENQRLRDELGAVRGASGHLAVENSKLLTRLESYEARALEFLDKTIELTSRPA